MPINRKQSQHNGQTIIDGTQQDGLPKRSLIVSVRSRFMGKQNHSTKSQITQKLETSATRTPKSNTLGF